MTRVIKARATEAKDNVTNVTKNAIEFVLAASLVIVGVVAGIAVKTGHVEVKGVYAYVVGVAVGCIALMAARLLIRHFNR